MKENFTIEELIDNYLNLDDGRIYIEKNSKSITNPKFCVVKFNEEAPSKDYFIYMKTAVFKDIVKNKWEHYNQVKNKYDIDISVSNIASSLIWLTDHAISYTIYDIGKLNENDLFDIFIFARYNGKWIFFKNHLLDRFAGIPDKEACYVLKTEAEKSFIESAEKALKEKGLTPLKTTHVCDFYYTDDRSGIITEAGGRIIYAEIDNIENCPANIVFSERLPKDLTYPKFTEMIFNHIIGN